jgi:hypothetical protein
VVAALAFAGDSSALTCPDTTLRVRLDAADGAFVGRVQEVRTDGDERVYRFVVDQKVKGDIGREVDVLASRLVDAADEPIPLDVAVGVFARERAGVWTTESCSLTDPGALLSIADEPRGNWIKVLIGIGILALVLGFSIWRLRKRQRAESESDPASNGRPGAGHP